MIFGLAVVASPGGGAVPDPSAHTTDGHAGRVRVGSAIRTYRLFVAPGLRAPAALVVALHGGGRGESGLRLEQAVGLDAEAVKRGWIVAYPDAIGGQFNAGRCCNAKRPDDARFIGRLVAQIATRHEVKRGHVYAVGFSAGGMMAYRLACQSADVFAAIAVVAGTEVIKPCSPTHPVSVLDIHARNDPRLDYRRGRFGSPSVPALNRIWRRRDQCRRPQATQTLPGGGSLIRARCAGRTEVQLLTGDTFGHTWPGALPPYGPDQPASLSATNAIASFLGSLRNRTA
jgi:polyhydroxybutyrate depolymerase